MSNIGNNAIKIINETKLFCKNVQLGTGTLNYNNQFSHTKQSQSLIKGKNRFIKYHYFFILFMKL